jgi:hypothetical protein
MRCHNACNHDLFREDEIEDYYKVIKQDATIDFIISEIEEKAFFCEKESALLQDLALTYRDLIKTLEEKKPVEDQGG